MDRPKTPESPTLQEQLQAKREQLGFRPPKVVEGRKSQKQDAIEMLKRADRYTSLGRGGKKSRKSRKSRRRLTRRR